MNEKDELQNNDFESEEVIEIVVPEVDSRELDPEKDHIVEPPEKSKKKKKKGKKKKAKKNKKKSKLSKVIFVLVLVCLAVIFGWAGYVGAYVYPMLVMDYTEEETPAPITEKQQEAFDQGKLTVLLMGSDRREGDNVSRSDTLMVAFVDLYEKEIRLLSMPRDTYVTIPTTGEQTKLNHAYAYGGVDLTKETLKYNFGIECEYFMDVDFQGFIDIIDALGGVTVDVPYDMYYIEEGIDLKAGVQTLDGSKALQFCRFRGDSRGDLGRIEHQQAFLVALKESLFSAGTLFKIPEISSAVMDNMVTDFTGTQLLQILLQFKDGVNFETYQPQVDLALIDELSYVIVTDQGQLLIDSLVAFGEIPEGIDATTDNLDVTVDPNEVVPETTETEEVQ
jgi:LCP family protein required for cell wall assembly